MKYRQLPYSRSNGTLSSSPDSTSTRTGKKNSVNRITKINTTTSRLDCRSRSLKSLTIRSGSKRSDGLRLLSIVEFHDNARFISCTVSKNRAGQYFVSVLVETEQCYKQKTGKTVGVDLGIKTLATLSDGIAVENSHFLCENQAKLKRMQRHLSRKKLGSNRRNKCRLKVSRLHRDIANKRSWYMHNLTTMLVNNYDVICIEDLNTSGMLQNHKLAGSVSDASFSMFRNQLEYKCRWYGKELIVIDRFYPSSKTCSRCGWKNKDLKLSDRTFVCKDCGLEIDRDLNAAINIQAVGVDAAIRTQSSRAAGCVEASKME